MKIVFADDSMIVRRQLKGFLERLGHEVVGIGEDGLQAIDLFKKLKPDAVILDIVMLQMNGDEAARAIRALAPTIPIVLLTSQNNRNTMTVADTLRAFTLRKPIEPHTVDALELALDRAKALVATP